VLDKALEAMETLGKASTSLSKVLEILQSAHFLEYFAQNLATPHKSQGLHQQL